MDNSYPTVATCTRATRRERYIVRSAGRKIVRARRKCDMRQWHEGRQPLNRAGRALLRGYGHSATVRRPGARVHASHEVLACSTSMVKLLHLLGAPSEGAPGE